MTPVCSFDIIFHKMYRSEKKMRKHKVQAGCVRVCVCWKAKQIVVMNRREFLLLIMFT